MTFTSIAIVLILTDIILSLLLAEGNTNSADARVMK